MKTAATNPMPPTAVTAWIGLTALATLLACTPLLAAALPPGSTQAPPASITKAVGWLLAGMLNILLVLPRLICHDLRKWPGAPVALGALALLVTVPGMIGAIVKHAPVAPGKDTFVVVASLLMMLLAHGDIATRLIIPDKAPGAMKPRMSDIIFNIIMTAGAATMMVYMAGSDMLLRHVIASAFHVVGLVGTCCLTLLLVMPHANGPIPSRGAQAFLLLTILLGFGVVALSSPEASPPQKRLSSTAAFCGILVIINLLLNLYHPGRAAKRPVATSAPQRASDATDTPQRPEESPQRTPESPLPVLKTSSDPEHAADIPCPDISPGFLRYAYGITLFALLSLFLGFHLTLSTALTPQSSPVFSTLWALLTDWKGWLFFVAIVAVAARGGLRDDLRNRLCCGEKSEIPCHRLAPLALVALPWAGMPDADLVDKAFVLFLILMMMFCILMMARLLINPACSALVSRQRSDDMFGFVFGFLGAGGILMFFIRKHPGIQLAIAHGFLLTAFFALVLLNLVIFARLRLGIRWIHQRGARAFLVILITFSCILAAIVAPEEAIPNHLIANGIEVFGFILVIDMVAGAQLAPRPPWEYTWHPGNWQAGKPLAEQWAKVDRPDIPCEALPVDESSLGVSWIFCFILLWLTWMGNLA